MAQLTLEQKILKAVNSGDFALAAKLNEDLKARKTSTKGGVKPKATPKKNTPKKAPKKQTKAAPKKTLSQVEESGEELVDDTPFSAEDESEIFTKARDPNKVGTGKNFGKTISLVDPGRKINFFDDPNERDETDGLEWIGKNGRQIKKEPRRPPAEKVPIDCRLCRRTYKVYPSYVPPIVGNDGDAQQASFVCSKCR